MAIVTINKVGISSIGAIVPKNIESNQDYSLFNQEDKEKFIKTVGIEERRFVSSSQTTTADLSILLVLQALEKANWNKNEVGALIFVSQMRDFIIPCTATILQHKLGLPVSCLAFDIPLGCSGYVYGLYVLSSLIGSKGVKKGILIAGDVCSPSLSYEDKSTYPLFGDASSCTLLEYDPKASSMQFNLESDGKGYESIIMRDGGCRHPFTDSSLIAEQYAEGVKHNNIQIHLDGYSIFEFSVTQVVDNIRALLKSTNNEIDDFDSYVLHQANLLIIKSIAKILKADKSKVRLSLLKYGNTSSTSIPLTIVDAYENKEMLGKEKILICGFGVGLSYASAIIETNGKNCLPLLEYEE
ncbi:MAG: 3-oxoacyl-[acyl-carrier-protein] synthase-3 [Salibacteraceae bacterium]|jgi:3-oxoacyl-[acyl-carrier-protein] synthase-3